MASWDDVRRIAIELPEVDERESRRLLQWRVRAKLFVWERPLRTGDLQALGDAAPIGSMLAASSRTRATISGRSAPVCGAVNRGT